MELKQYIENFLKSWNIINYGVDYCIDCEKASYEELLEEVKTLSEEERNHILEIKQFLSDNEEEIKRLLLIKQKELRNTPSDILLTNIKDSLSPEGIIMEDTQEFKIISARLAMYDELKSKLVRWMELLKQDGLNTKSIVYNDMQYYLKEKENEED